MVQSRVAIIYFILDTLIILVGLNIASTLRMNLPVGLEGPDYAFTPPAWLYVALVMLWIFAFRKSNLYERDANTRLTIVISNSIVGNLTAGLLFFGLLYLTLRDFSRLQSFYVIGLITLMTTSVRVFGHILYRVVARLRNLHYNCLIIGVNENGRRVGEQIIANKHTRLLGYIPLSDEHSADDRSTTQPVIGSVADLSTLVNTVKINEVIIAFKWYNQQVSDEISDIMHILQGAPINVRLAPDFSELVFFHLSAADFKGIPLIGVREQVLSPTQRLVKRLFDLLIALSTLLVIWPLLALIALLIRINSRGPIFIQQERIGMYGRPFTMFKFRSMYAHVDQLHFDETKVNIIKRPNDPRVTPIGRILRRTSLDELPQLFNVIRGDMSLVGPRPELPNRVRKYEWWQSKRFEVPQGMTGWWQINGRADRPMHLHTEDDLYYVKNYSLWLDFKIILRTVIVVISGRGAF